MIHHGIVRRTVFCWWLRRVIGILVPVIVTSRDRSVKGTLEDEARELWELWYVVYLILSQAVLSLFFFLSTPPPPLSLSLSLFLSLGLRSSLCSFTLPPSGCTTRDRRCDSWRVSRYSRAKCTPYSTGTRLSVWAVASTKPNSRDPKGCGWILRKSVRCCIDWFDFSEVHTSVNPDETTLAKLGLRFLLKRVKRLPDPYWHVRYGHAHGSVYEKYYWAFVSISFCLLKLLHLHYSTNSPLTSPHKDLEHETFRQTCLCFSCLACVAQSSWSGDFVNILCND